MASQPGDALGKIDYWVQYIDCALKHPRPLPAGKHAHRQSLETIPEVAELYHCIYKLYNEEESSVWFREPVNALAQEIFTYYDVIKSPMSLRQILDSIVKGDTYSTALQVMEDVELIWKNCITFNGANSLLATEAGKCRSALDRIRRAYQDDQRITVEEAERLFRVISSMQEQQLIDNIAEYLRRDDPTSIDETGAVNFDMLKRKHFRNLERIVDNYSKSRTRS
ncbi:hypothetical protein, conserved [Leishmania tarentolae]|uniref:Bromo domain-containing protein n=1 Tax=Leishmania tarentolae TaxID=5689 RepID=A0A640KV60_LEITA|nr:hypothetical protein, conserved [Leishmania tarentolae]